MSETTILVATWSDGVYAVQGQSCTPEFAGQPVRGLAADGRGGALAIVGGHALCRRSAEGAWTTLAESELELSCCVVVREDIFVGTDHARVLRLSPASAAFKALDGFQSVAGRETWFSGSAIVNGQRLGPPLGVRSIAANADGSILFANVHVGGIPRSLDGGKTWQPTIDIFSDVHEVCAHPQDPQLIAAASAVGLAISRDAGTTWSVESAGLHAPHCSATVFLGEDILVSAAESPFSAEGRVYRLPISGSGPLTPVQGGLPVWTAGSPDTGCIAVSGATVVLVDRGGNVYRSADHGQSWSSIRRGLPSPSSVLVC